MLEISGIGILSAFAAGFVSFLSPCVLPLVPGYLSYVSGQSLNDMQEQTFTRQRLSALFLSLCFVSGFATVFMIFGASATVIGQLFSAYRYEANILGGIIIIIFGLFIAGLLPIGWLQREFRVHNDLKGGKPLAAYILGLAFAFGWTPCIGPILGAILTVSATSGVVSNGLSLLAIYSAGLGLPFILAALFTDQFFIYAKGIRRHGMLVQKIAGILLIIMGIAMVTGYLSTFSIWLLNTLPWLGQIG